MSLLKHLFSEKCPHCHQTLETSKSKAFKGIIIKSCPEQHFQKEYHPALETYVEQRRVL